MPATSSSGSVSPGLSFSLYDRRAWPQVLTLSDVRQLLCVVVGHTKAVRCGEYTWPVQGRFQGTRKTGAQLGNGRWGLRAAAALMRGERPPQGAHTFPFHSLSENC